MYATSTQWNEDTKYFSATIRCYCSRNMIVRCGRVQGLKYLKMSTTHKEGRWRGRRPRARHGGAKRRSAEGGEVWGGATASLPSMGVWGIAPRKFWNLTVQICSFFHNFKTEIASPSEISIAFSYFTQHTPAKSTAHLTKSAAHFVSENTQF